MTASQNANKSGSALWIGIVVAVVALGIVAVVVARGGSGSDSSKASSSSSVEPGAKVCPADASTTTVADSGGTALPAFGEGDDAALCRTIPTLKGKDLDGKSLTIGADDGKAKIIVFVAHWCPHCQKEVPLITEHLKETPMPDDVELLAVSTSVQESADNYPPKAWLDRVGWPVRTLADSADNTAGAAYGLTSFPYFVVADSKGQVIYRTSGEITMDQFDAMVRSARTGKAPA